MIRVLQCVNDMNRAGLETMLMNYYRHIDREEIQFDFLTHRPYRSDYEEEILQMGGRVYHAPRLYPQNYPAYFRWMKNFFREHPEYEIMHSHIDAMSALPLLAGKLAHVPVRLAHSHNTSIDLDFKYLLKQCFRRVLPFTATGYLACGEEAGRFLFGKRDFTVITNAIDGRKFCHDPARREEMRSQLQLEDAFVVGHIGRLSYQKNHSFLLQIFAELVKAEPSAVLLIIGTGEKEEEIRRQADACGLQDKVRFLGKRSDCDALYQAMDVFVLPSLFEGVPVVGVEAQFAGLPCFFSDKTPEEVQFTDRCLFLSLQTPAGEWAQEILKAKGRERSDSRELLETSPYEISNAYRKLETYYKSISNLKNY